MAFTGGMSSAVFSNRAHRPKQRGCINIGGSDPRKDSLLKHERIREFRLWQHEKEEQRLKEFVRRRMHKELESYSFRKHPKIRKMRLCYIIFIAALAVGSVFTLCSLIRSIGGNTFFYAHREVFRIIGPIILVLAFIMFCVVDGIEDRYKKTLTRDDRGVYVLEKKRLHTIQETQTGSCTCKRLTEADETSIFQTGSVITRNNDALEGVVHESRSNDKEIHAHAHNTSDISRDDGVNDQNVSSSGFEDFQDVSWRVVSENFACCDLSPVDTTDIHVSPPSTTSMCSLTSTGYNKLETIR